MLGRARKRRRAKSEEEVKHRRERGGWVQVSQTQQAIKVTGSPPKRMNEIPNIVNPDFGPSSDVVSWWPPSWDVIIPWAGSPPKRKREWMKSPILWSLPQAGKEWALLLLRDSDQFLSISNHPLLILSEYTPSNWCLRESNIQCGHTCCTTTLGVGHSVPPLYQYLHLSVLPLYLHHSVRPLWLSAQLPWVWMQWEGTTPTFKAQNGHPVDLCLFSCRFNSFVVNWWNQYTTMRGRTFKSSIWTLTAVRLRSFKCQPNFSGAGLGPHL